MITLNVGIRVRLASTPLERDEGEYAYAGQLLLQGIPPYVHAYNMKFPGTYAAYALMMAVFGQTGEGAHLGMAVMTSINLLLVFLLAKRFWNVAAAIPATVFFGLMQLDVQPLTLSGHATHVVVLAGLAGLLCLPEFEPGRVRWVRHGLAGICCGLAILAKQPGAMFVLVAEGWLVCAWIARRGNARQWLLRSIVVGVGCALPLLGTVLWLWYAHALTGAKFWTVDYARAYGSETNWRGGLSLLGQAIPYITRYSHWLWITGAAGIAVVWFLRGLRLRASQLTLLAMVAFLAVSAGFYYRPHYFILLMPAIALGVGGLHVAVARISRGALWPMRAWTLVWIGIAIAFVHTERRPWFTMTPVQLCNFEYGDEAFTSAGEVGSYLKSQTKPTDTVAILGSEPEIFFDADRRSATGYIYMYPLFEKQPFADRMQHEMSSQIEAADPKFVVLIPNQRSWGIGRDANRWIDQWWARESTRYELVNDIIEPQYGSIPSSDDSRVITIWRRRAGR